MNDLHGHLGTRGIKLADNPISVSQMGELIDMVQGGKITGEYFCFSGKEYNKHGELILSQAHPAE